MMPDPAIFRPEDDRDALVRFRHVYKVYRIADTGVVALAGSRAELSANDEIARTYMGY